MNKLKIPGIAFLISLSVLTFSILFSEITYHPKKMIKRGYEIEISADGKIVKKDEPVVDIQSLIKVADVSRGEKLFKKCASCHTIKKGEGSKIGPNLFGVVSRKKGSFAGFSYSEAMKLKGGSWDIDSINQFITKPKDFISGTKMAFAGVKKPQDRADIIAFLEKNK